MIRSMEEFVSAFHAARCVSTPLVSASTQGMYQYMSQPTPRRRIIRDLGGPLTVMRPSKAEA